MNYDRIAKLKVDELRQAVRIILKDFNLMTKSRLTAQDVARAPKARLLYILTRYWVEYDVDLKYRKMIEDLKHREAIVVKLAEKAVIPAPVILKQQKLEPTRIFEILGTMAGNSFRAKLTVEEVTK